MAPKKRPGRDAALGPQRAQELIDIIERHGELPEGALLQLLRGDEPSCDVMASGPCKPNRKDSPNCFCNIIPSIGSSRKKGLWMKEPALLSSLGSDPNEARRQDVSHPCGLRNLGNTCYVNSALQCLFEIPSFRRAMFEAEGLDEPRNGKERQTEADAVRELRRLFLLLQFGPRNAADTAPFAKVLNINPAIQQDGQEFMKLLMTVIERVFASEARADIREVLQRLFRGYYSHITTCKAVFELVRRRFEVEHLQIKAWMAGTEGYRAQLGRITAGYPATGTGLRWPIVHVMDSVSYSRCGPSLRHMQRCGRESESSKNRTALYELTAQVRNFSSLVQSLVSSLEAEVLEGDNQYACDYCGCKVDATRQQVLRQLPPYLCVALQRFDFNYETGQKIKASDKFSFPLELDFGSIAAMAAMDGPAARGTPAVHIPIGPDGASPAGQYELMAVLIHKGTQASSGHYVAHVRDPVLRRWWRFDDETVTDMGERPLSSLDHGAMAVASAGPHSISKENKEEKPAATKGRGGTLKRRGRGSRVTAVQRDSSGDDAGALEDHGGGNDPEFDPVQEKLELRLEKEKKGTKRNVKQAAHHCSTPQDTKRPRHGQSESAPPTALPPCAERVGLDAEAEPMGDLLCIQDETAKEEQAQGEQVATRTLRERRQSAAGQPALATSPYWKDITTRTERERAAAEAGVGATAANPVHVGAAAECTVSPAIALALAGTSGLDGEDVEIVDTTAAAAASAADQAAATSFPVDTYAEVTQEIVSSNAYMLVYRHQGWTELLPPSSVDELPAPLREQVDTVTEQAAGLLSEFEQHCADHERQRTEMLKQVEERQEAIRSIIAAATPGADEPSFWISTAWLEAWANADGQPPAIDNSVLLCKHNKLDPNKLTAMKRISFIAWEQLQESHKGGPTLPSSEACYDCIKQRLEKVINADTAEDIRAEVGELLARAEHGTGAGSGVAGPIKVDSSEEGECCRRRNEEGPEYYVSKTWLSGWLKRQGASVSATASPTAAITCPHGGLAPDRKSSKRFGVSKCIWLFLRRLWENEERGRASASAKGVSARVAATKAEDLSEEVGMTGEAEAASPGTEGATAASALPLGRLMEFPIVSASVCQACIQEHGNALENDQAARKGLEAERNGLAALAGNLPVSLEPDQQYYLVPRSWVQLWQEYIALGAKRAAGAASAAGALRPMFIHQALAAVLCSCHPQNPMLIVRPPRIVNRRNKLGQEDIEQDDLQIVTEAEWKVLTAHYLPANGNLIDQVPAAAFCGIQAYLQANQAPPESRGLPVVVTETAQPPIPLPPQSVANGLASLAGTKSGSGDSAGGLGPVPGRISKKGGGTTGASEAIILDGTDSVLADEERRQRSRLGSASSSRSGPCRNLDGESGAPTALGALLAPTLLTVPGVCEQALAAVAREARQAQLTYFAAEIMVELIPHNELERAFFREAGAERKSKRARKNRVPITVSSTTTLRELQIAILQQFSVHPTNQRIYVRGMLVPGTDASELNGSTNGQPQVTDSGNAPASPKGLTLAQLEIFPDEEVRVVNSKQVDDDDLTSVFSDGNTGTGTRRRELETGFTNTVLTRGTALPAATTLLPPGPSITDHVTDS